MIIRENFLDTLRAVAISSVVLVHYFPSTFPGGSVGVSVFFVLSGYLVTQKILVSKLSGRRLLITFYTERIFRIYPSFVIVFSVVFFLASIFNRPQKQELTANLIGLISFTEIPVPSWYSTGVYWTLSVEIMFYLFIPILFLALKPFNRKTIFFLVSLISVVSYGQLFNVPLISEIQSPIPKSSFIWIGHCLIGSLVACLRAWTQVSSSLTEQTKVVLQRSGLVAILLVVLFVSNDDRRLIWPLESTFVSIITALLIMFQYEEQANTNYSFAAFASNHAYSIYLLHGIPLDFQSYIPGSDLSFMKYSRQWELVLMALFGSILLRQFVERPFIRVGKELSQRFKG